MKITLRKDGRVLYPHSEEDGEVLDTLSNAIYQVDIKNMDMRTLQQNKAIHKWCEQIAHLLNSRSLYMMGVFGNEIEWTMEFVKAHIIKATIKQVFKIDSTTKLKRKEIDEMVDFVTIAFAKKNVEIPPFPSASLFD